MSLAAVAVRQMRKRQQQQRQQQHHNNTTQVDLEINSPTINPKVEVKPKDTHKIQSFKTIVTSKKWACYSFGETVS